MVRISLKVLQQQSTLQVEKQGIIEEKFFLAFVGHSFRASTRKIWQ